MKKGISIIVLLVTLFGCQHKLYVSKTVDKKEISITDEFEPNPEMVKAIEPYKEQLDAQMEQFLTYNPYKLEKGLNANLANLLADQLLEAGNEIFNKKYNKQIDVALLNHGGIRRTFTPGNITVRSIFELMPFENSAVVVKLSGKDFMKMIDYLKEHRVGHPISGFSFSLDGKDLNLYLKDKPFDINKSYWVITNDYLQKGGDGMDFFTNPEEKIDLKLKLRDIFIDEFKKNDTLKVDLTPRYLP
ncbi:5'-nucleotidase C-terminal domain-containing protein [Weeksellaceae bacterium TAE3-ERU29]|nr:5'-nucleotidase C-terminal domain-containing protein [Weeksellaceae bacterium TAE3-ERU29]